jgi:hypothetical protein
MSLTTLCLSLGNELTKSDIPLESLAGILFIGACVTAATVIYVAGTTATHMSSTFPLLNFFNTQHAGTHTTSTPSGVAESLRKSY